MSVKTKTVEVRRCDFCIATSPAKACENCGKDACSQDGRVYRVTSAYWHPDPSTTLTMGHSQVVLAAFLCGDCLNEMKTALLRLGFTDTARVARTA